MRQKESGQSERGREVERETLVDTSSRVAPLTSAEDPPPYGAQHRQDARKQGEMRRSLTVGIS
ncbi:hypothetical protein M405DRAFT_832967 [Rhizopogon salebrosus TDB-379]|nr:hypothetical protein M405DRAFT_832967 [Rhizopogon salebrosus TDB-379]